MRPGPTTGRIARLLAPVLAGVLVLAACAGADPTVPAEPAAAAAPPAAANAPASTGSATSGRAARKRPNVVVVMADDMRVDDLDFAPFTRRLFTRHGLTFENAFSPFPLCCPARASFLSGRYAHNHEVFWHERPYGYAAFDDSRTIATSMAAAGYRTAFIGKYLNGYGTDRSLVSGKPSWRYVPNGWTDWIGAFENPGVRGIHGGTYFYRDTPYNVNGRVDNGHRGEYQTDVVGDFSVRLARRYARGERPFFIYVSYVAPHHGGPNEPDDPKPVRRTKRVVDDMGTPARPDWVKGRFDRMVTRPSGFARGSRFAERRIGDKPTVFRRLPNLTAKGRRALVEVTRQRAEAVYVLDRNVRRLVERLKRTGEWRDTVLMFTSDNGYFLGEHRQSTGKVRAHEPSLRVPLLVTGPGLRTGERRYDPITTVDLTATILDIAGADAPHPADGISRWDTMRRGDRGWRTPVVTEAINTVNAPRSAPGFGPDEKRSSIGLRTARWSFTLYRDGQGELYDLKRDPAQMSNRFGDPAYRDVQRRLTADWWRFKDCEGADCRRELAGSLQASAKQARRLGRHYWKVIDRRYAR